MSTLIRCLDNEIQGSRGAVEPKNGDNNAANHKGLLNNFKMPRNKEKDDDNERLDTIGGDDEYDGNEELDIEKRFTVTKNLKPRKK